jgi:type II secretory pathway component GspD/PulD (secretin)
MNKPTHAKVMLCCFILAVGISYGLARPKVVQAKPGQSSSSDIGRSNPFEELPRTPRVTARRPAQTFEQLEETPNLFLEIVTLKYRDAKSAGTALQCMSSSFGNIAILEKSNSLIVFDTEENLERILGQIKKIDKPIPGLLVEAVTLKSLDVKNAKGVLEKMSSASGNITIVDKSNSLIVCDTKENVEKILAEIKKIDQPMPGLVTEAVTLRCLDAKSTKAGLEKMSSEYGSISVVERTNSLIICDTKRNLDMILAEIAKIDRPTSGLSVETVNLKFLDAENLKKVLDKMVSQYGSIATNPKSNSLIICDIKENLAKILAETKKADRTPQQIMVEVFILDVKLEDDTEIGINWDLLSDKNYDVIYRQNLTTSRLGTTIESADTIGNATAFNTTGLGGDFAVISGTVRNVVHMLQQKKEVEILASPALMVLSGQSATIKAVEEIPYEEMTDTAMGGAAALTSTKFKPVGVNLRVTATITGEDGIFLTVDTEQNVKTSESRNGVPVVDTRQAQTSLLLNDGQIVAVGGLRRREKTKKVDQIPIIGNLPIIGELFKNTITMTNNSELVVLLSPHIYKGEPIPSDVMAKYNEIKNRPVLAIPHKREKESKGRLERLNE